MTTQTANKPVKPKKTLEQALQLLKEKQKALASKAAKLEKDIEEKKSAANQVQRLKFAKLGEDAGILGLSDSVLAKAFADIAGKNGVAPAAPAPEPAKKD